MRCSQWATVVQVYAASLLLERHLELTETWEMWGWRQTNHKKPLLKHSKVLTSSAISRKCLLTSTQIGNVQLTAVVQASLVACTNGIRSRDMALNHHLMQKQDSHCMRSNNVWASSQTIVVVSVVPGKEQVGSLKIRQASGSISVVS